GRVHGRQPGRRCDCSDDEEHGLRPFAMRAEGRSCASDEQAPQFSTASQTHRCQSASASNVRRYTRSSTPPCQATVKPWPALNATDGSEKPPGFWTANSPPSLEPSRSNTWP